MVEKHLPWDSTFSDHLSYAQFPEVPRTLPALRGQRLGALPQGHGLVHVAAQWHAHCLYLGPPPGGPSVCECCPGGHRIRGSSRALPWACACLSAVEGEGFLQGKVLHRQPPAPIRTGGWLFV